MHKKIIPIEFSKTDYSKAALQYEGIPAWISFNDKSAFYNTMKSALTGIAVARDKDQSRNQFLLGLAYLMGIGVEKNSKYALSYISSAAEAGLSDAMERFVSVYYSGEGADRSMIAAIHWQKRLIEYYIKTYETTAERKDGIHIIFEQHKLYGYLIESGQQNAAGELSVRMKKLASQLRQKYPRDYSAIECLVISLSDVADFLDRCGDYKKSKKIQRYLSKLNKSLAYDTGLFDASEDLLINYQHLERTSEDYGDYSAALKYYRQSLAISEKMKEADGSDALYHRWLDDLYRVVHCYLQLHSPKQAEEYLRKSLEGYIALQSTGSETWRIYHALSSLSCQKQDLDITLSYCTQSIQSAQQEEGLDGQRHLSDSYSRKADILTGMRQYADSEQTYLLALSMMEHIADRTGAYEDKERFWKTAGMFGDYHLTLNKTGKARKYYQIALSELNNLHEDSRCIQTDIDLAQAHQRIGLIAVRQNNLKYAKSAFTLSIDLLKKQRRNRPTQL